MSLIKAKDTGIERLIFKYLKSQDINFRKHYKLLIGKPDIVIPSKKIVIFIDGDFWHGWHYNKWSYKLPNEFWRTKIEENMRRDKRIFRNLRKDGWKILRVWEHQMSTKAKKEYMFNKIIEFINI